MLMLNIYKIQYVVHFIIANIFGSMWLPEFLSFFFFFINWTLTLLITMNLAALAECQNTVCVLMCMM